MGYPSAQHGLTWDPHGAPYNHNPRPPIQASVARYTHDTSPGAKSDSCLAGMYSAWELCLALSSRGSFTSSFLYSAQLKARECLQAAGMHLSPHGRLPPGMAHQYMASPHMWPAQAAVRLPPQQQPNQAQIPQQAQQYQPWQADPQWQPPSHRQNRQRPVTSTSTGRSGNLSRQHSGENASRRFAHTFSILLPCVQY